MKEQVSDLEVDVVPDRVDDLGGDLLLGGQVGWAVPVLVPGFPFAVLLEDDASVAAFIALCGASGD